MNLPDAGHGTEPDVAEQNTRDESNPAHFSVKPVRQNAPLGIIRSLQNIPRMPFRRASVLFRYSRPAKLMQKIHRLTDN